MLVANQFILLSIFRLYIVKALDKPFRILTAEGGIDKLQSSVCRSADLALYKSILIDAERIDKQWS